MFVNIWADGMCCNRLVLNVKIVAPPIGKTQTDRSNFMLAFTLVDVKVLFFFFHSVLFKMHIFVNMAFWFLLEYI